MAPVGLRSGTKLLLVANGARTGRETTPYALWTLAAREAATPGARVVLFRHAMLHAGFLQNAEKEPYSVCPVCDERLAE